MVFIYLLTTLWENAKLKILDFLRMELKKLPQGIFFSLDVLNHILPIEIGYICTDLIMLHVWFLVLAAGIRCHFCRCLHLNFGF